jgi:hypothetical protein
MFLVTIVLGVNLMAFYYVSGLNIIFGLIAYIYVHAQLFGSDG